MGCIVLYVIDQGSLHKIGIFSAAFFRDGIKKVLVRL